MTLRELFNAVRGYEMRQMLLFRATWEQTRILAATAMNSTGMSKKRFKPGDMIKLPWDTETKDRSDEIEEIKERRKWRTQ